MEYFVRELPPRGRRKGTLCVLIKRTRDSGIEQEHEIARFDSRENAIEFQQFLDLNRSARPEVGPGTASVQEGPAVAKDPRSGALPHLPSQEVAPEQFTRKGDVDTTSDLEYGAMAAGTKRYRRKPPPDPNFKRPTSSGLAKRKGLGQAEKRMAVQRQQETIIQMMQTLGNMKPQQEVPVEEAPPPIPTIEEEISGGEFLPEQAKHKAVPESDGSAPGSHQNLPTKKGSPPDSND